MKTEKENRRRGGFKRIADQVLLRYYSHDVPRDSAALTYYLLFAVFPLLIFISALLGALQLNVESITAFMGRFAPPAVVSIVRAYLQYISGNSSRNLLWFSLIFSVWFPMRATSCLMHSVRKAYGYDAPSSMWRGILRTLIFTVMLIISIALTVLLTVVGRRALNFVATLVTIPEGFIDLWSYLRFVLMGVIMAAMLWMLYMLALGEKIPARQVWPGVLASLAGWLAVSMAFSYYVEHFAHYAELYGSIATIVVALLWLYWSGMVLILGAELNGALMARRRRRKRMEEPEAPEEPDEPDEPEEKEVT